MPQSDALGCVYFAKCDRWLKVGYTQHDPIHRMKALKVVAPYEPELLATLKGAYLLDEGIFHEILKPVAVRNEWFAWDTELAQAITYKAQVYDTTREYADSYQEPTRGEHASALGIGPEKLAGNLAAVRANAGLSRAQLAARSYMPTNTVSRIEGGAVWGTPFKTVKNLARKLGISATALLAGDYAEQERIAS